MKSFRCFHTEATSSGHWENVRLTKIIKKTYQDGTAVGLIVDKERGVFVWTCVLTIGNNIRKKCNIISNGKYMHPYKYPPLLIYN